MNSSTALSRSIEAALDISYMRRVVEHLAGVGSSPLGFRLAGTAEEVALSAWLAEEMEHLGLKDVALEAVPVDAWRFGGAHAEVDGVRYECASFGGVPGTPADGITGDLVFVARGTRSDIAGLDLQGKVALLDWRGDDLLWPSLSAAEAARAGARAVIVTSLPGGSFYQSEGALGAFDSYGLPGPIPMLTIRKEDAVRLIERSRDGGASVRVSLDATLVPQATAYNVVGTLPGRSDAGPIVVAGHHDAWFWGALDDATGVAATLALAKAMCETGYVADHPIVFCSHTAEEFGLTAAPFDYCIGAGWQISQTHPEWAESAALYLNLEGTGMPQPLLLEAPPELQRFADGVLEGATRAGLLPYGIVTGVPRPWTEAWPFLSAGVPAINVNSHHTAFFRQEYHTQYDTPDFVDFQNLHDLTRVYGRLITAADAASVIIEPAARSTALRRNGRIDAAERVGADTAPLQRALDSYEKAALDASPDAARRAFTVLAREVEAIDAAEAPVLRHEQALRDVEALDAALGALAEGAADRTARALEDVGRNSLARHLSEELAALDAERHHPEHHRLAWAEGAHLTASPMLWGEIASLRADPSASPAGSWIAQSLAGARRSSADDLQERLDRMTQAFERARELLDPSVTTTEEP